MDKGSFNAAACLRKALACLLATAAIVLSVSGIARSTTSISVEHRPADFVDLVSVVSTVQVDIRYSGFHNFIGHPVAGYEANRCLLTRRAADAVAGVQQTLMTAGLSLRVYDCYRPQRAVNYFVHWAGDTKDTAMSGEFYSREPKADLLRDGYVASPSSHSRGSTVDLTIIPQAAASGTYKRGQPLRPCFRPAGMRFDDGALDMGTGYDCFDVMATERATITAQQSANRLLLKTLMIQAGFLPYKYEWWHFTLRDEPYRDVYFDFPVK